MRLEFWLGHGFSRAGRGRRIGSAKRICHPDRSASAKWRDLQLSSVSTTLNSHLSASAGCEPRHIQPREARHWLTTNVGIAGYFGGLQLNRFTMIKSTQNSHSYSPRAAAQIVAQNHRFGHFFQRFTLLPAEPLQHQIGALLVRR